MQIAALGAPGESLANAAGARAVGSARTPAGVEAVARDTPVAAPVAPTPPARTAAPARGGLSAWNPGFHGRLAGAQQALSYLDKAGTQLQGLKADLSGKLAGRPVSDAQVAGQLRQFAGTWQRRAQEAGGLSSQLEYDGTAPAAQRFTVRGLSLPNLRSGERETLALSVGGAGRSALPVQVEPELSDDVIVHRFAQALAPARIGVAAGDDGALVFSVPEGEWPRVRDSLAIRGGGIRFAGSQPARVKIDAQPPAVQPETWQAGDDIQLRQTLQQVVQAIDRVRPARESVARALAAASAEPAQAAGAPDPASAASFAESFVAAIAQPGFAAFSPLSAASSGISRDRVRALLAS